MRDGPATEKASKYVKINWPASRVGHVSEVRCFEYLMTFY